MSQLPVTIRRAQPNDAKAIGGLGAKLSYQHVAYDEERFVLPERVNATFERFFIEQLSKSEVAIAVAELEGDVVGYVFVRVEPESFVDLLGPSTWIHDIYVEESARGFGIGPALLAAAEASARELGSKSVMLTVSPKNERAREIFEEYGFRLTMQEMRMEL